MILKRYIQVEIGVKLGWVLGLLLLVLSGTRLVDYLADTAAGRMPGDLILRLLLLKMLSSLPKLIPVAVFIAVILGLSRLAKDRELTIFYNAGLAFRFQLLSVLHFSLVSAFIVFLLSFYLAPWAERQVAELRSRARTQADISGIQAGKFKEFSKGDRMVYAETLSRDKTTMENVFLQVRRDGRLGVLNSGHAGYVKAERSGRRYILFRDGRRYIGSPGQLDYRITEYRAYALLLDDPGGGAIYRKLKAARSEALFNSKESGHVAELQWRISAVLSVLLLSLLAVALSRRVAGEQRYALALVCLTIYFIYSNMLGIAKTMLTRGQIPAYVGVWWVHLALILIAAWLFLPPRAKKQPDAPHLRLSRLRPPRFRALLARLADRLAALWPPKPR